MLPRNGAAIAVAPLAAVLVATTGCANLDAVRGFAKASAATADAPQVLADYARSPTWLTRYETRAKAADLAAQAEKREVERKRLVAVQGVLVGYFTSLGAMAADDLPNVDDPVDGFAKELKSEGVLKEETASAAASIAQVVIRASLDGWRRKRTADVVRAADPHVQKVVAALKEIVEKDFSQSYDLEQEAVEARFKAWQASALHPPAPQQPDPDGAPPVARLLMEEHLDAVRARRAAAAAYASALGKIGDGHAALARNVGHLDAQQLEAELAPMVRDLRALYQAVQKLVP